MNEALKAMHMQTITEENAVKMYDALCDACEMREGGMTDPDQMLVADIARAASAASEATDASDTGRKTRAWRRCGPTPNSSESTSPNCA